MTKVDQRQDADKNRRLQLMGSAASILANQIAIDCPDCDEKMMAMAHLEQAVTWAKAAIEDDE